MPLTSNLKAGGPNVSYNIDIVTGTMNASVPLYNVAEGDINVPVLLSYGASGVKVNDDDGWVGHNWNVSAQSYGIFRQARGLPDDYSISNPAGTINPDNRKGWLFGTAKNSIKNFTPTSDNNASTCTDELQNYTFLNGLDYNQDTEPDVFRLSAPGLSFEFYFDENNIPRAVPYQNVIITPYTSSGIFTSSTTIGPITLFKVVDSKGVTFEFAERESITEDMYEKSQFYFVRKTNQHERPFTYYTSWRLTKIISPIYGTVDLTYTQVNIVNNANYYPNSNSRYPNLHKYRYPLITSNEWGAGSTLAYQRSSVVKVIKTIGGPSVEAEFISVPKYTGSEIQRLNKINIYDKRLGAKNLIKELQFNYTTTGSAQQKRPPTCNISSIRFHR